MAQVYEFLSFKGDPQIGLWTLSMGIFFSSVLLENQERFCCLVASVVVELWPSSLSMYFGCWHPIYNAVSDGVLTPVLPFPGKVAADDPRI